MSRLNVTADWEDAWVDDEDAFQEEEDAKGSSQQHGRTEDTAYFTATDGLGISSRQGIDSYEDEDLGYDEHAAAYEDDGHGGGEEGHQDYQDRDREGSALDQAFLRPTGPNDDSPGEGTKTIRSVRWQGDDQVEGGGLPDVGLEWTHEDDEGSNTYTGYYLSSTPHSRTPSRRRSFSPRRGSPSPRGTRGGRGQGEGSVTIVCRVRPFLPHEKPAGGKGVVSVSGRGRIVIANPQVFGADPEVVVGVTAAHNRLCGRGQGPEAEDWARAFEFHRCIWSVSPKDVHYVGQSGVYTQVGQDLATHALTHGVDVALFAYGASQSGKTYTLLGPEQAMVEVGGGGAHEELGLLPRVMLTALQHVRSGLVVSLSCLELHGHSDTGGLRDLLLGASGNNTATTDGSPGKWGARRKSGSHTEKEAPVLRVREHPEDGPFVENLSVINIQDTRKLQQVLRFLRRSMRSADGPTHTLYTIYLDRPSSEGLSTTRVQLVELAAPSALAQLPPSPRRLIESFGRVPSPPSSPSRSTQSPPSRTLPHTLTLLSRLLCHLHNPSSHEAPTPRACPLTWLLARILLPLDRPSRCSLLLCLSPSAHAYADSLQTLKYGQAVCAPGADEALCGWEGGEEATPFGASPVRDEDVSDWRLLAITTPTHTRSITMHNPRPRKRALVAEEQSNRRQTACQTQLSGGDVVSRSAVPSSEELWALKAKVQHLEHDLQCAVLDRDVALSESRSTHDELKRTRGREMKALAERAREAETKLSAALEQREESDAQARRVQEERDYVRQLLEETKARHLQQLQALEQRRVDAEAKALQSDVIPSGGAVASNDQYRAELEALQSRVMRSETECEEARSMVWDHKAAITQLTHAKIEAETRLAILGEELESTRAKLQQQSRALFALQRQHAAGGQSGSKPPPPPQSQCPRASPLPFPSAVYRPRSADAALGRALDDNGELLHQEPLSSPARSALVVALQPLVSQQHKPGQQLEDLEVQQDRRRPSPLTTVAQVTPKLRPSPSPPCHGQAAAAAAASSPKARQPASPPYKSPYAQKHESLSPTARQSSQRSQAISPKFKPEPQAQSPTKQAQEQAQAQLQQKQKQKELRALAEELVCAREALRAKDSIILQQSHEARTLAETLQRRVMSLERVAGLEGAALKEGLRREAGSLSRELRGWTGRHRNDYNSDAHNVKATSTAAALEAPAVATPTSHAAASGSAYDNTSPESSCRALGFSPMGPSESTAALVATLQATVASLREDKARLEERVSFADQRAAKAMEAALVEVLLGVKDENARVRDAVSTMAQDKQSAEQRLLEMQHKNDGSLDYGRMFRRELAALWMALKGGGGQDQTLQRLEKEMDTLRAKTHRLGEENVVLRHELAATTRQLSPPRAQAHAQRPQGVRSSPVKHSQPSRQDFTFPPSPRPSDPAYLDDSSSVPPRGRDPLDPSQSLPRDFSSVMAAACLDDPEAIEQAVQFEIELALQSLLASHRAEATSYSHREDRRTAQGSAQAQSAPPPPPPPDAPPSTRRSKDREAEGTGSLLGRKRKERPSVGGGGPSGAVTQSLQRSTSQEGRKGSLSTSQSQGQGHGGFASTTRSQALRHEAIQEEILDKRQTRRGSHGAGGARGQWATQSYPASAAAGRAGAEGLYATMQRPR